jgi:hypothetical protein
MKLEKFLIGLYSIPLTALLVPLMVLWHLTYACIQAAWQIGVEYVAHIDSYNKETP